MIVYHEVNPDALRIIRREGLKRTSRGDKGDDQAIIKTDKFLDEHRLEHLRVTGVSRDNNLYGYLSDGEKVIDTRDGKIITVQELNKQTDQVLLKIAIDSTRCYVSDIDAYDRVKSAIEQKRPQAELRELAHEYWGKVEKFDDYRMNACRRPEVMVTYDIRPDMITVVNP